MTKKELIEENKKLKDRIKDLENNPNNINVNRINVVLENKQELFIYKDQNRKNAIVFQFTTGIAVIPCAINSFTVIYDEKRQ